jgi:hypothetical protein
MTTTVQSRSAVIRTAPIFFANSVLAATLGVILSRVAEQFCIALVGAFAGRDAILTNSVADLSGSGNQFILLAGTAGSLILGFTLLMLYPHSKDRSAGRLVMLWTMLFSFRSGLAALVAGPVDDRSPVHLALERLGAPAGVDLALAVVGIVALVLVSVGAAPAFLSFARHRSEIGTTGERLRFVSSIALVPGLIGPLLAVPVFLPDGGDGFVRQLPLVGIIVVITVIAAAFTSSYSPPQVVEERGLSMGLVSAFIVVVILVKFGLNSAGVPIPPWDEKLRLTWRP